jgi:23S rRNA pseudouridine2605 synthase
VVFPVSRSNHHASAEGEGCTFAGCAIPASRKEISRIMAKSARGSGKRGETHYNKKEGNAFKKGGHRAARSGDDEGGERPYRKREGDRKPGFNKREDEQPARPRGASAESRKPYPRKAGDERPSGRRPEDEQPFRKQKERPYGKKREDEAGRPRERKYTDRRSEDGRPEQRRPSFKGREEKPFKRKPDGQRAPVKRTRFERDEFTEHTNPAKPGKWNTEAKSGPMTLNKYLAHAGVSSRRDAADTIKQGKVQVNGKTLTEPGYRVQPDDKVTMDGKVLKPQKGFVYVLLNKPKDFLTTTEDDRGRHTVMELVKGATDDRLYPVGRLDRNTTGVLLLTNDGDLAQKLSHPKYECKKIYQVSLDKELTKRDFDKILEGVMLEDGLATVDRLAYLDKKSEVGLEIHSGRNRIVRRIFEHLGYNVDKLDRVMYAGLTKKNVSRGKWRFLTEKEVIALKHFRT